MATLLALAIAAPAAADHGPGFGWDGPAERERFEERIEERAERLAELLELTPAQRDAFEALRADRLEANRPRLERMRALGAELRELLASDAPAAEEVGRRVIAIDELRDELRASRESFESEFGRLLSAEQRFAWEALREARPRPGEPGGPHGGQFGPRRGGPPA
jgi:Spy/CpxP family protein refolding chaperone